MLHMPDQGIILAPVHVGFISVPVSKARVHTYSVWQTGSLAAEACDSRSMMIMLTYSPWAIY